MTDRQVALLEAWSTLGAAVLAAVASFFAFRAYVKESRIEKRLRDSDERAQASLVAAWIGIDPNPDVQTRFGGNWVVIRNASETPIYNVTWWIQLVAENVAGEREKAIPPNALGEIYQPPIYIHNRYGLEDDDLPLLAVGLEFTDSSGGCSGTETLTACCIRQRTGRFCDTRTRWLCRLARSSARLRT